MKQNATYLRITIHDRDFTDSLQMIGELLYEIFQYNDNYPTEENFSILKESIKHLWLGTNMVNNLMCWGETSDIDINYFEPDLEFVDYFNIPDWDNGESIYIPMFDDTKILCR